MRRHRRLLAALAALVVLGSCSKDSTSSTPVVANIHVTPGTDTIGTLGRTVTFTAQPVDAAGSPVSATVVWRSSNPAVVTVDSATGLATAVANGTAVISAHAGSVVGQATMAVSQVVAHVVISPPSAGFSAVGDTQRLAAVAKDSSGALIQGVQFLWGSNDANVATVDTAGLVTGRGAGQATISATGRGIPGYAALTVNVVPVSLAFRVSPAGLVAGTPMNPAVQVEIRDGNGHPIKGANEQVTVYVSGGPPGGSLAGTTVVNAVAGVAAFSGLTIRKAGVGYTLTAITDSLTSAPSPSFTVVPGAVGQVVFSRGPQPVVAANNVLDTIVVALKDTFGNTIDTGAVNMALATSPWPGMSIQGSNGQNLVNGVAKFGDLSVASPGRGFTLVATAVGGPHASSAAFTVELDLTAVSAGAAHACGLGTGAVFCWGDNSSLQAGGFAPGGDSVPHPVQGGLLFTQVTAGAFATCGLVAGGQAYCWGNYLTGELGDSDRTVGNTPLPVPVAGNHLFRTLASGTLFFCGLAVDSTAFCWGQNDSGQLGDGSTLARHYPVAVAGGLKFAQIAPGDHHTCGLTGAGKAYCWGGNDFGQLGDSTTASHPTPAAVIGGFTFKALAAGAYHTCGLNGTQVMCWGESGLGQLGDGSLAHDEPAPRIFTGMPFSTDTIVAGFAYSCATGNGSTACWGDDRAGQLGDLSTATPVFPVLVAGGFDFITLSAHPRGSFTCGRRFSDGAVLCWGANSAGQLGDGTTVGRYQPTPVIR